MVTPEDIIILVANGSYDNIHGVPSDVIDKMKDRWESIPGENIID
jgi:hypothetical protein